MEQDYRQMIDILQDSKNLLITGHQDPDGDCIGSMLGIYHAFNGKSKGWQMVLQDEMPSHLAFLNGFEEIISPRDISIKPDGVLLLDCAQAKRAGTTFLDEYLGKVPFYVIDHHPAQDCACDYCIIEDQASATGEICAAIVEEAGISYNLETASALYSAIVSDTGCFRYLNTTPRCFAIAARLLAAGIDLETVRINIFENNSLANMKMLGLALQSLKISESGLVAWMKTDLASKQLYQAKESDLANIINYALSIQGVKIGVFFQEKEGEVKVGLRSRKGYAIDGIARSFGGGGHLMAAGCTLSGTLDEVSGQVLAAVKKMLEDKR